MTMTLGALPTEIIILIVQQLVLLNHIGSEREDMHGKPLYISYYDWNPIMPCKDLLNFARVNKQLKTTIDPFIYKNLMILSYHEEGLKLFKDLNQYCLPYNSFLNYSLPIQFHFEGVGKYIPISILQYVQHLILSFGMDEGHSHTPATHLHKLVCPKHLPSLREISFLFEYRSSYQGQDLELVGLGLKEYTTPVRSHMLIITDEKVEPELNFLETLDIYSTIESFEIELSPLAIFQDRLLEQISWMTNLIKLVVTQEAIGFPNLASDNVPVSEIVRRVSRLAKLEELELLIGDYDNEKDFQWYLAEKLECLTTTILAFELKHLPEDLNIFNSVTHLEISMNHGDFNHKIVPPFCNLTSLGLYDFSGSSLSTVQKIVDTNKRLVNLSINDLSEDMYPKITPLLYRIESLECYGSTGHRGDPVTFEFMENPPIHYIPQECPNIRSLCLPIARLGTIRLQNVLEMANSKEACPNLSTIFIYEATPEFFDIGPFRPSDLFSEAFEKENEISEILPHNLSLNDFCVPVVAYNKHLTRNEVKPPEFAIEIDRLRTMLKTNPYVTTIT